MTPLYEESKQQLRLRHYVKWPLCCLFDFQPPGCVDSANKTTKALSLDKPRREVVWPQMFMRVAASSHFSYNTGAIQKNTSWNNLRHLPLLLWARPLHRCGTPKWGAESVQVCDPSSRPGLPPHLRLLRKACSYQAHSPRPSKANHKVKLCGEAMAKSAAFLLELEAWTPLVCREDFPHLFKI